MEPSDVFLQFAYELADGERWKMLRADDWETFQERLAEVVGDLPPRRRQESGTYLNATLDYSCTYSARGANLPASGGVVALVGATGSLDLLWSRRRLSP